MLKNASKSADQVRVRRQEHHLGSERLGRRRDGVARDQLRESHPVRRRDASGIPVHQKRRRADVAD